MQINPVSTLPLNSDPEDAIIVWFDDGDRIFSRLTTIHEAPFGYGYYRPVWRQIDVDDFDLDFVPVRETIIGWED